MTPTLSAPGRGPRRIVVAALVVTALAYLPLLFLDGLFWDDWTWRWTWQVGGAAAIDTAMWQIAHPGYAPVFNAFFALGGDDPGSLARAVAITAHLLNGVMLWRALDGPPTRIVAAPTAAIFLVAPWFTARGTLSHAQYDVFLACYLGSILLSRREGALARVAALALQLAALSLETLAALEILRLARLAGEDGDWRAALRRAWPHLALAALVGVLRLTVIVPQGPWAEYNAVSLWPRVWVLPFVQHMRFLVRAVVDSGNQAMRLAGPILFVPVILGAAVLGAWSSVRGRSATRPEEGDRPEPPWTAAIVGAALVGAGALPYALAGQFPWTAHFGSRFAFVSQFGAALLLASALATLPYRRARRAALAAVVALFALATAQNGKALVFDEEIQEVLRAALDQEFAADPTPRVVALRLAPRGRRVLYRGRCLSSADLNVPRRLAGGAGADSFVYDVDCVNRGEGPRASPPVCTVGGLDRPEPCPTEFAARVFTLDRRTDDVREIGLRHAPVHGVLTSD